MPTREEMIAFLEKQNSQQPQQAPMVDSLQQEASSTKKLPSREDMISFLNNKEQTSSSEDKNIINEQHPAIAWDERLKVKNFGGTPEESMAYLQQKYPNLQFSKDADNEIIAKGANEKSWKRLDPTGFQLNDLAADIGDVGYDAIGGIAETAGGALGALGGTALGPAGTLGGAAAGAGATSTAGELLRQKIGEQLGMNKVDAGEALTQGAISAVLTPVMGVGGGAWKGALKSKLEKTGLAAAEKTLAGVESGSLREALKTKLAKEGAESVEKALTKIDSGYLPSAATWVKEKVSQPLTQLTTGIKAARWRTYFTPEGKNFVDNATDGEAIQLADDLFTAMSDASSKGLKDVQARYSKLHGDNIKLGDVREPIDNMLTKLEKLITDTPEGSLGYDDSHKLAYEELKQLRDNLFSRKKGGSVNLVRNDGLTLDKLQMTTKHELPDTVDFKTLMEVRSVLSDYSNKFKIQGTIKAKTNSGLAGSAAGKMVEPISETAKKLASLSDEVIANSGDSALKRDYKEAIDIEKFLNKFKDKEGMIKGDQAFEALNQLDTKSGRTMFKINKLREIADKQGFDLQKSADLLMARKDLKNPDFVPTVGGSYSAGRSIGTGALGLVLGGGTPAAAAMGVFGTGPKAMKAYGNFLGGANRVINKYAKKSGLTKSEVVRGLWNSTQDKTQQQAQQFNQQP